MFNLKHIILSVCSCLDNIGRESVLTKNWEWLQEDCPETLSCLEMCL